MDDTAGSGGAARRRTTGSPAKPPGKTRAKAATGSGRAAAAPAKRASGTSRTARTRTAPAGPEPGPGGPGWSGPPERAGWRASRSRALYSRRIQRVNERWPLATQVAAALLSRPELVLGALGQPQPVERDGRLLNRRVQAMLELDHPVRRREGHGGRWSIGRSGGAAGAAPEGDAAGHAGPHRRPRLGPRGAGSRRGAARPGSPLPAVRDGTRARRRRSVAARHRLLPRGQLGHRRPRHPRRHLPPAGRHGPVPGGGGRLPTGAGGSVPRRRGRRGGRLRVGPAPRR